MEVLISGATGLIGSELTPELEAKGHTVRRLTRHPRREGDVRWDLDAGTIDGNLSGIGAVVHLAGESIAEGALDGGEEAAHSGEPAEEHVASCGGRS